eukprot:scaffold4396_cov68-Phaeocystis_antarctica.AAC.2
MTQAEMVMKDRNIAKLSRAPSPKGSMRSAAVRQVNMISLGANFCPKKSRTWLGVGVRVRVRVGVVLGLGLELDAEEEQDLAYPERRALRPPVRRVPHLPAARIARLGVAVDPLAKLVPVRDDGSGLEGVRVEDPRR